MTFDEWWKESGQVRGEAIFRHCWNNAIQAAIDVAEQGQLYNQKEGHVTKWKDSAGVEYTAQHDTAVALRRLLSEPHSTFSVSGDVHET